MQGVVRAGGGRGPPQSYQTASQSSWLESQAKEGDSPVGESSWSLPEISSSASPVEPGVNQRGPPRKAKYSLVTDSEEQRERKVKRTPVRGVKENLKPYTYKRSEPY
eukprot:TRINITY_DN864_c1_g1_i1.p3 TRINITY_DN864_c1_g1~~TRINITY_DN864_c1_g1_i1.p3  ORF type:complete len:107 (+),score=6.01 TRINITY_DN864_c1_g1_i1:389-709(+)